MDRDVSDGREAVLRHLTAVESGDVVAMAADYAVDAQLVRPDRTFHGTEEIAEYFRSVPGRLGGGTVVFEGAREVDGSIVVAWRITGGPGDGRSGHDTYSVVDGRIVHQQVSLDDGDF
jgi:ketosteroid isomerase-like protein